MRAINGKTELFLLTGILMAFFGMGGCTMAPGYERPAAPVENAFPEYEEYKGVGQDGGGRVIRPKTTEEGKDAPEQAEDLKPAAGMLTWREFYTDPNMQKLIGYGLENNRDLRLALLNVEKVRSLYQIQRSELLPGVGVSGAAANQRTRTFQEPLAEASVVSRRYTLGVGVTSYEVDIFGRVRSLKDAALENYFATAHAAYGAQVAIVGEIASMYLRLVAGREQYELTRNTYKSRMDSYNLVEVMYRQGLSSQLTVNQAKATVEDARVNAVTLYTGVLQLQNALEMLLGGPLPEGVGIPSRLADVQKLNNLPEGLTSHLLERRPDILQAEHVLKSANANIGAARANFFPAIRLTGSLGFISGELDDLFGNDSRTWSFTPSVSLPIFSGGRNVANLEGSFTQRDMAVASYEKAIQTAFREVADALAQRSTITEQLEATKSLRDASQESFAISNVRYEIGMDSFMNVLDAQRMLFSAEQAYINSELQKEINTINLYKALGGGWQ